MHVFRWIAVGPLLLLMALCCGSIAGCGDESKTTGTRLEMSPEAKQEIQDMKSVMLEERAARSGKGAAAKTKGKPASKK